MTRQTILVLSGGSALGAYQAGAYAALFQRGLEPERIVGSSIGAVTAALIAGGPPEGRTERLRRFWDETAGADGSGLIGTGPFGDRRARPLPLLLFGHPPVWRPRLPGAWSMLPGMPGDASLYDLTPLRARLERLVDFDRLNGGSLRLTVVATDLATGEERRFDTAEARITVEHLLASSGFLPYFPPVAIDGRLFCDGGLSANLPLTAALDESAADDRLCVAVDLFSAAGGPLSTVAESTDRQLELLFATQSRLAVEKLRSDHALRQERRANGRGAAEGATTLLLLTQTPLASEVGMKAFDWTRPMVTERWEHGRRDMEHALVVLDRQGAATAPGELVVHDVRGPGDSTEATSRPTTSAQSRFR
ncbi:patatin-like phospholipase family protein [Azospirillum largimobile]